MLPLLLLSSALAAVPGDDAPWEVLSTSPVKVECARVGGVPWCRSEGVVHAPIDAVSKALKDMRYNASAFSSIVAIDVLDESTIRVVLDYPSPLDDRDYVARYTYTEEGPVRVYSWVPAVHPGAPEVDGVVRLPRFEGSWRMEPREGSTWVRYTWQAEIQGSFPSWGYAQAWKKAGLEALKDLARTQKAKLTGE